MVFTLLISSKRVLSNPEAALGEVPNWIIALTKRA